MKNFCVFVLLLVLPSEVLSSVCDTAWDGDKIVDSYKGSSNTERIFLRANGEVAAAVTVRQVQAFHDAKERISRVANVSPSFIVCGDSDANAFATNGGNGLVVGVTAGMLKLVNGNVDMAAAVIGHEFAHHVKGHVAASKSREAIVDFLGLIVGIALESRIQKRHQVSGIGIDLGEIGSTLVSRKFDRDQEREADRLGFEFMQSAGFNPVGAIQLANRMNQSGVGGAGLFFDSHPGWPEREAEFKTLIANSSNAPRLAVASPIVLPKSQLEPVSTTEPVALAPTYTTTDAQKSYAAGAAFYRSGDIVNAVREFRSSAEAGYSKAQVAVAYFHSKGLGGLRKDEGEAARLYKLAADQGNALGQVYLGELYQVGRGGLKKDDVEAVRLYQIAADKGNTQALANLGFMYANGRGGLKRDDAEALRLYRIASDKGNAQALNNLGVMYESGRSGLARDDVEAVRLYRLATDKGNAQAQANLGVMIQNGRGGLKKDDAEATRLFKASAAKGNAQAQSILGNMFANGRGGLTKDDAEAVRLYRLAAGQENAQAQANLGYMYENGRGGLPKDIEAAIPWYRLAARQGRQFAIDALKRLGRD